MSLTPSFLHLCFISFSCLTALTRTFHPVLNKNGESEHACLSSNLKRKALCFSEYVTCGSVIYDLYSVEVHYLHNNFVETFYVTFCQMLFQHLLRPSHDFCPSCCQHGISHWFEDGEPSLNPWNKYHLIMVYDLSNILLNHLLIFCWIFLSLYLSWMWDCNFLLCTVFVAFCCQGYCAT